jgi:hypothetical protein
MERLESYIVEIEPHFQNNEFFYRHIVNLGAVNPFPTWKWKIPTPASDIRKRGAYFLRENKRENLKMVCAPTHQGTAELDIGIPNEKLKGFSFHYTVPLTQCGKFNVNSFTYQDDPFFTNYDATIFMVKWKLDKYFPITSYIDKGLKVKIYPDWLCLFKRDCKANDTVSVHITVEKESQDG